MVVCNFIMFWSIAAFSVHPILTQVEPSNLNSGHPETNSGRNEQTCLETDNIEEKVVKDKEVENNCNKIVSEYSTTNEVKAKDNFEKETNFSLAVSKAYVIALHNARNFHWNCLCGAFVPQFEFSKYFVLLKNLDMLNNEIRNDLPYITNEHDAILEEDLMKSFEPIFIKSSEEIYSDICDNEHSVWKNGNAVWIEFSYYMMNIIENIHSMIHNHIILVQRENVRPKFEEVFEYMSILMSLLSNIESKRLEISETDVRNVRFLDKFMNSQYSSNKIEAKVDDSKNAVNTRKIVQCSFEVTLKFLQTLPSDSKDGNSCNDSVARVVKSLKTMKQATQNLHEIYRLNGSNIVLYEPSLEQKVTLDLENIVHICAQYENEKKIRNITNMSAKFSTTVKVISDIASYIVEFPRITPESQITTFFLSGATEKVYEYFLNFINGTAKDETIVQRLQNLSNSVTGFRNTEPLKPEDKKETILIPSRIFEMFKSKDSENIQSVINTAKTITKVSGRLIKVIRSIDGLVYFKPFGFFETLFEKLKLLTEVSNDFLELFKSDKSPVNMYEQMVVKKLSQVHEHICVNITEDLGPYERNWKRLVIYGAQITKDISIQILEMLEELSRTYDEFTVENIKRLVILLSNDAERLFSIVKLLDPKKPVSPEEMEKESIWFREGVLHFMHPIHIRIIRDIRMYVGHKALSTVNETAKFSKQLHLKIFSSSSGKSSKALKLLSLNIHQLQSVWNIISEFETILQAKSLEDAEEYLQSIQMFATGYAYNMLMPGYTYDMPRPMPEYAHVMPMPGYAHDLPMAMPGYAHDMPRPMPGYVHNMPMPMPEYAYDYDTVLDNLNKYNSDENSISNNQTLKDFSNQIVNALSIIETLIYKINENVKSYKEADGALSFDAFLISILGRMTQNLMQFLQHIKFKQFQIVENDVVDIGLISTRMQNLANSYENE